MILKSLDIRPRRRVIPVGRAKNEASCTITPAHPGQSFQATVQGRELLVSRRQSWEGGTPVWLESEGQSSKEERATQSEPWRYAEAPS